MSFQPRKKSYILVNADGDVLTIDEAGLEEFIRLNDVGYEGRYCEPSWADELRALQVGQTYHGGGGASPEWSVERGQGSPAHQGGLRSGEVPAAPREMKGKWPTTVGETDGTKAKRPTLKWTKVEGFIPYRIHALGSKQHEQDKAARVHYLAKTPGWIYQIATPAHSGDTFRLAVEYTQNHGAYNAGEFAHIDRYHSLAEAKKAAAEHNRIARNY